VKKKISQDALQVLVVTVVVIVIAAAVMAVLETQTTVGKITS
jgi:hypothetical protein